MAFTTFAAIDVGSYEVEMVIYEVGQRGIKPLDHMRYLIPLGRDTYNDRTISYRRIDELCDVLASFVEMMKTYDVKAYRAITTSAIREAANSINVLDRIRLRTGLKVEVLSNSEQRLIMYEALSSRRDSFESFIEKGAAMADVGSGSSQISLFDNGTLVTTQNIQLGALRVNELINDIARKQSTYVSVMEEYIDTDMEVLQNLFIKERKIESLIAVGDYINWIVARVNEDEAKEFYTREEFLNIYQRLYFMGDIREKLSLSTEQAESVLPCMMIYKKLLDATDAKTIWIPGVKLCDGLAVEYAIREKKCSLYDHDFNADIVAAAKNISKRYSWNKEHVKFVEKNAVDIFDATKKLHGLGKREKLLLQIACILHDCGQYISILHPAECSYNIVMSTEIIGLSHREREMVANIVKYNTIPFNSDGGLDTLPREDFLTLSKLTAIIQVANTLDRGHKEKFKNNHYRIDGQEFQISTETYEDISLEKGMISFKATLFEEVYGLKPVIVKKHK